MMERLTTWRNDNRAAIANNDGANPTQQMMKIPTVITRLAQIEDILGDEYDLDRLETIMLQRMTMREEVAEKMKLVGSIPIDRLREIVEADKNGNIVFLPCKAGDTVWRVYDRCELNGDCGTKQKCNGCEYRNVFAEEQGFWFSMLSQNGKLEHPYYTSKKAAEEAVVELKGKINIVN